MSLKNSLNQVECNKKFKVTVFEAMSVQLL